MSARALAVLVLFGLALAPRAAHALSQSKHRSLSMDACSQAHLPYEFCDWVGAAAFNVDRDEWDVLAAHAQPELGQSRCDAANATLARVSSLGFELQSSILASPKNGSATTASLASALGRVLHTIQDNCAHSGIPNIQHAWASLSDSCTDSELSPDIQPEAIQCAKDESAAALSAFADALASAGVSASDLAGLGQTDAMLWPDRDGVCEFLKSGEQWDGIDQRWDNALVRPALRSAFANALGGEPPADICASGPSSIDSKNPAPPADVSQPPMWCGAVALYCVGKGDGASELPPWESKSQPTNQSAESSGGCSTAPAPRSSAAWGLLGLAALFARARRTRR